MQAVDIQVEELAVPADARDRRTVQRGQRRVERLDRAQRRDVGAHDGAPDRSLAQERGERLDLGQLRHGIKRTCGCRRRRDADLKPVREPQARPPGRTPI